MRMNTKTMIGSAGKAGMVDFWILAGLIAVFNLPLLAGGFAGNLLYSPERVLQGEWWRVVTAPFVHLSLYHLALDAGAFLLLYRDLSEKRFLPRLLWMGGAWAAALAAVRVVPAEAGTFGLCGLSGIAHGLMAVRGLELVYSGGPDGEDPAEARTGLVFFLVVAAKSIVEALTGHVFLESLHLGYVGNPVAACHAGGVLGGTLAFLATRFVRGPGSTRSLCAANGNSA